MNLTQEQAIKKAARIMGITVEEYNQHAANGEKRCATCKKWKRAKCDEEGQESEFPLDRSRKDGIGIHCKVCRASMAMRRRQAIRAAAPPKEPRVKKPKRSRAKAKPIVADVVQPDEAVEVKPTRAERVAKVAGDIADFKAYIEWRKSAKRLTDLSFIGDD